MEEQLILVDENDNEIGAMEKLAAHQDGGRLHRAISVFVFHPGGRVMLQRRAKTKYHCGGLWSNTCCSHPRPGEDTAAAANRRLQEEMGFECDLKKVHEFTYRSEFHNGLTEHEYDHVFVGVSDKEPVLNPEEADDWKWIEPNALLADMEKNPENYTYWLRISCADVLKKFSNGHT